MLERKEKWAAILADEKVDPKGKDTVLWIYKKLGGLVRTHEEQVVADKKAAEMNKKSKKK